MSIVVKRIENKPVSSNCFVIFDKTVGNDCLIVDPGGKNNDEIINYINGNRLIPTYIILTHEHFDHCWGVNDLVHRYEIPVICSSLCAECIEDVKRNCSVFYDNSQRFEVHCRTIKIESLNNVMDFAGIKILFFNTPGHTDASISFLIGKYLFTGDTLIYKTKTVTKLPTGSESKLKQSISLYKSLSNGITVMSGHGESFGLDCECDINNNKI